MKKNTHRSLDFELTVPTDLPKLNFVEEHIITKLTIKLKDVKWGDRIAQGSSANIYIGYYKNELKVCIKEILPSKVKISRYCLQFLREIINMSRLQGHENILPIYGCYYKQNEKLFYLCKFCSFGSIYEVIKKLNQKKKNYVFRKKLFNGKKEDELTYRKSILYRWKLLRKCADGIRHIHEKGFINGDLKCMNILFDEGENPYICDFGFLQKIRKSKKDNTTELDQIRIYQDPRGTIYWMSPEMLREEESYISQKSDVWSFGIILFEIFGLTKPYEKYNPLEVKDLINNGEIVLDMKIINHEQAKLLINKCLNLDDSKRPSIKMIIEIIDKNISELSTV